MSQRFVAAGEGEWTPLGGGVRRKVLGHTTGLMAVLFTFEKGAVGAVHQHDVHHQTSYVLSGSFEAQVGDERRVIRPGDMYIVQPNTDHGVVALEDGSTLLDHFTPLRDEFIASP